MAATSTAPNASSPSKGVRACADRSVVIGESIAAIGERIAGSAITRQVGPIGAGMLRVEGLQGDVAHQLSPGQ
jgi:hypothetical protein